MQINGLSQNNNLVNADNKRYEQSSKSYLLNQPFSDDFEITTNLLPENNKNAKSKNILKKACIAVGIAALATGGVILAKKIGSKNVKQLAENIEFINADTIDDAIKFGQEHLGIKQYKGFCESDLSILNWINEGLVDVNNVSKGKAKMPKLVEYVDSISAVGLKDGTFAAGSMSKKGKLSISKKTFNEHKEVLTDLCKNCMSEETFNEAMKRINNLKNFSDVERAVLKLLKHHNLDISQLEKHGANLQPKGIIYHEIGHSQHSHNIASKLYDGLAKTAELKERGTKITPEAQKLRELFESKINLAENISDYATTSPCEFVAECYKKIIAAKGNTNVLNPETLDLYKKLGGVLP